MSCFVPSPTSLWEVSIYCPKLQIIVIHDRYPFPYHFQLRLVQSMLANLEMKLLLVWLRLMVLSLLSSRTSPSVSNSIISPKLAHF